MGYRDLVQDLIKSAEGERDRILFRSREEARDIISRAMEEAESFQQKSQENLKRDISREIQREKIKREKDIRVLGLRDKRELVDGVFQNVEEKLRMLPGSRGYPVLTRTLLKELKGEIRGRPYILRADSHAKKTLRSESQLKGIKIEKLSDDEWGGLELVLNGGKVRLRNTLKSRYEKNREKIYLELGRWIEEHD